MMTEPTFYTPFYGGIYFTVDKYEPKAKKVPLAYNKQFYVEGTSGKFFIDNLYYQNTISSPKKATYFYSLGVGILRKQG
jgi:hypothetical protein